MSDGLAAERERFNEALAKSPCDLHLTPKDINAMLGGSADSPWKRQAEIIAGYVAPHDRSENPRPRVVVRFVHGAERTSYLRHSAGPCQGFFWDCYGDHFQSVGLALRALMSAPRPPGLAWKRNDLA